MKFKLINTKTNEEALCDKVTIGGFDYYVSDAINIDDFGFIKIGKEGTIGKVSFDSKYNTWDLTTSDNIHYPFTDKKHIKRVIATTNPNINIPKVVDEVVSFEGAKDLSSFVRGYNKAKETYQFTEKDMINFAWWLKENIGMYSSDRIAHFEGRYFQTWKEQPKTLYYNA